MNKISSYRNRFNQLMESTMGDVRPLISEEDQREKYITPKTNMINFEYISSGFDKLPGLNVSVSENEYKLTLPKKEYKEGEYVHIKGRYITKENSNWNPNSNLDLPSTENDLNIKFSNRKAKENQLYQAETRGGGTEWQIYFSFPLPKTQDEFKNNQPFGFSTYVPCKNVKGGKIKITVEVPEGSTIGSKK